MPKTIVKITTHLVSSAKTEHEMQSGLLLDVVIREGPSIFELLTSEDQPLLVWRDSLLVLDLGLDVLDGVGGLHLQGNGLAGQGLDEDLHSSSEPKHKMKGALLLDVVIAKSATILKLLPSEDQPLLVWRDSLLVLDLGLDILDGVGGLHLQGDGLAGQGLNEDLHTSTKTENQMKSGLLLDVVIGEGSSIFELLTSEDEPLLVWGDTLLVLDLGLDILDGVGRLNFESDGLPGESLDENLHSSTEPQHKMKSRLLLDVVIAESTAVLKLLTSKDQPLLVWGDTLLVLDLGLDVLNGVGGLHLQSNGLPGQSLHEDLHSSTETEDKMEGALLLDVIVGESPTVLKLLSSEDQPLLVWRNTLLVLDLSLDVLNGVRGLDLEGDGLPGEGLDENLHFQRFFVWIFL